MKDLLIRIAQNDDKEAFSTFYKRNHEKLITYALRFLPTYQDAEDVVSEVIIKLLRQRKTLHEVSNIEGYLYLAVKNQSLNYLKKKIRRYNLSFEIDDKVLEVTSLNQPIHLLLAGELENYITRTIEQMPPQRKLIFKMVKDDGLKHKEVAELLEISDKTVKKHIELAIRDLKKVIEDYNRERPENHTFKIQEALGMISILLCALA